MEEALQPLASQKSEQYFPIGIAVSLGLHLALSALLLGTPSRAPSPPNVSYIDLSAVKQPAEMTAPPQVPTTPPPAPVQKVAPPAAEPVPEKPAQQPEAPSEAAPAAATPQSAPQEKLPETTLGMGMTKGYFSSIGNGETLKETTREYYLEMLQRINERWWLDQGVDRKGVGAIMVSITIARNGTIVDARLARSSGNKAYDKAVLQSLASAGPLAPLPEKYEGDYFMAPIRLVPPLNLMSW